MFRVQNSHCQTYFQSYLADIEYKNEEDKMWKLDSLPNNRLILWRMRGHKTEKLFFGTRNLEV